MKTRYRSWLICGGLGFAIAGLLSKGPSQAAEFPPCPPPAASEYLLLIRGDTEAQRTRIQDVLPASSTALVCNYLGDTVVRGGGFTNLENANAWAQYMTEIEGFQAFVARPSTAAENSAAPSQPTTASPPSNQSPPNQPPAATPPSSASNPTPPNQPTAAAPPPSSASNPAPPSQLTAAVASQPATSYNPRALGAGYAVLVDYQNRPELAVDIQKKIGQAVGLAVYRQNPYLLIAHSPDVPGAASTLAVLSSKSIPAFIVDSRGVVMLTNAVALRAQ